MNHNDTKDWTGFEVVFAPDASVDYAPEIVESSEWHASAVGNVVALVRRVVEHAVSIHHGHMAEIEITYLIFWPERSRRETMHGWGHYHKICQKIGGKWLIKTAKLTRLRVENAFRFQGFDRGATQSWCRFQLSRRLSGEPLHVAT